MKRLTVCVVSHTHWDREWYHSAARFRQQLVPLIDALLARPEGSGPFLLDGQAIVLEDYLDVRPEEAVRISESVKAGELEAGPWYVLADGLIPSGEALVRNLQAGRRVLRRFGAVAPSVAYCPDTFGHSHAIPTLAEGFAFPIAITWRGYGGRRAPSADTVRWVSENGASVIMYHLPPDGYETGSAWPAERGASEAKWRSLRAVLEPRANTGVVLLPNGADHHALQRGADQALAVLRDVASPAVVVRESLAGFATRLVDACAGGESLPVVRGELRDSYGYTWTLGGTYGTRAAQKRANARAERTLLRDVEPWLVLAWLHGTPPSREVSPHGVLTMAQAPALLNAAWQELLRAHPHDTLCGCSIDAVARAMNVRLESVQAQAAGLRKAALDLALRHDVVAARDRKVDADVHVVIRNRASYARGGVAELLVDETLRDENVGPGSAVVHEEITRAVADAGFTGVANTFTQHVSAREVFRRRESPQHYPDNDLVREHRVLAWIAPVPAAGLRVETVIARATQHAVPPDHQVSLRTLSKDELELSNGLLTARATLTGIELTLHDDQRGARRTIASALTFETSRDVGDSYTPAIRGEPELLDIRSVKRLTDGPLRGSIAVSFRTKGKRDSVALRATISLDAGAEFLRVDINGRNARKDHRLRVNFHSDVSGGPSDVKTFADAAFGPVERRLLDVPIEDQSRETVPPTMPMHRWVAMSNARRGATLHSDGLAEVEANAQTGTFSLTLLRAIGQLSRNDLRERPGHAGWPAPIPLTQSQGRFHARIGLQVHEAWSETARDTIEQASDALLLPLVGATYRDLQPGVSELTGPELRGAGLRVSAVTLADNGKDIALRCVNDSEIERKGAWHIPHAEQMEFAPCRLDETLLTHWQSISGNSISFRAPPRAVLTFLVRRRAP